MIDEEVGEFLYCLVVFFACSCNNFKQDFSWLKTPIKNIPTNNVGMNRGKPVGVPCFAPESYNHHAPCGR